MKMIDFEAHYYSDAMFKALCSRTQYPYCENEKIIHYTDDFFSPVIPEVLLHIEESVQTRLKEMDACGVSTQVLGNSQLIEEMPADESIACAKATNNLIYKVSKDHPGRFICFGTFPVRDVNAAVSEMERCKNELGFKGWMTFSNFGDSYIDEPQYLPLLAAAERLKLPIYIHPSAPKIDRLCGLGHAMAAGAMGFTIDTAITLARLIYQGVFDRFPSLQVIIGHLGEGLPYSLDRMDQVSRKMKAVVNKNEHEPSYYFKNNIWVTTSGIFSNDTFTCAKSVLGIDRILFGSDYPYEPLSKAADYVRELELSESDRAKVCYENSERLFSLC